MYLEHNLSAYSSYQDKWLFS